MKIQNIVIFSLTLNQFCIYISDLKRTLKYNERASSNERERESKRDLHLIQGILMQILFLLVIFVCSFNMKQSLVMLKKELCCH